MAGTFGQQDRCTLCRLTLFLLQVLVRIIAHWRASPEFKRMYRHGFRIAPREAFDVFDGDGKSTTDDGTPSQTSNECFFEGFGRGRKHQGFDRGPERGGSRQTYSERCWRVYMRCLKIPWSQRSLVAGCRCWTSRARSLWTNSMTIAGRSLFSIHVKLHRQVLN